MQNGKHFEIDDEGKCIMENILFFRNEKFEDFPTLTFLQIQVHVRQINKLQKGLNCKNKDKSKDQEIISKEKFQYQSIRKSLTEGPAH